MATTQVSITYGGKQLDCELSYKPPRPHGAQPYHLDNDYDFTLEKVSLVCAVTVPTRITNKTTTHIEDITDLIKDIGELWEHIEELSIDAVNERGYI